LFGFAVGNDLGFLNAEYERYNLPPIKVKAYDIARIIAVFLPSEKGGSASKNLSSTFLLIPPG
jgi:hypothetical protein